MDDKVQELIEMLAKSSGEDLLQIMQQSLQLQQRADEVIE
jgi:hypothetical protein